MKLTPRILDLAREIVLALDVDGPQGRRITPREARRIRGKVLHLLVALDVDEDD